MAIRAVTTQEFGFPSVEDIILAIATFMTDDIPGQSPGTTYFELEGAISPTLAVLRATNIIDEPAGEVAAGDGVVIPATQTSTDLIWGITLRDISGQLQVSWGRMLGGSGNALPINSEVSTGDPTREENEAFMTATDSPAPIGTQDASHTSPTASSDYNDTLAIGPSNLHGYRCTITKRGFVLAVFSQIDVKDWRDFGFVMIQRPVDCDGNTLVDRKAPLFAVWNNLDPATGNKITISQTTPGGNDPRWYKSVLLEEDVFNSVGSQVAESLNNSTVLTTEVKIEKDPDIKQIHFENKETLYGWPVLWNHAITQDNNEIPLVFPFGLTTSRFCYLEELDLACVGPACVFTFGQEIDLTVFTEARKYQVLTQSSSSDGVTVGVLIDGPEFTV